jgi:hypothetical protein
MNQLKPAHYDLDHISASGAMNSNAPAHGEICNALPVEGKVIDTIGTVEERNGNGCHRKIPIWRGEREV